MLNKFSASREKILKQVQDDIKKQNVKKKKTNQKK